MHQACRICSDLRILANSVTSIGSENQVKKLEKISENPLTRQTDCDIIIRLSRRAASGRENEMLQEKNLKKFQKTS